MIIGKIRYNEDLLDGLIKVVKEKGIREGGVFLIGALQSAKVGYYDQSSKKYIEIDLPFPQEIVSGIGNVSLKDDEQFIHLHLSLSDSNGNMRGGHLLKGCKVFACEYIIIPSRDLNLQRKYDEQTGLFLLKD